MITPVILCGGAGTRLWPLSRKSFPKQFTPLVGKESLFTASVRRLNAPGYSAPIVVAGPDFRFIVKEQLAAAGVTDSEIMIEPDGRNTAPAILAAALQLAGRDIDTLMLVVPSDHLISDADAFRAAVMRGVPAAEAGQIVTFGISPTRPEIGFGWLEPDNSVEGPAAPLRRFVEKPNLLDAQAMLESGHFLWNSGIFLFSARSILEAFDRHAADMVPPVRHALDNATADIGFLRLDPEAWDAVIPISIDYAIMEQSENLSVVSYSGHWSDLGGWDAVAREMPADPESGVVTAGAATAIECRNSLIRSESEGVEIVGVGLDNIIAVAMNDAVLVADRSRVQDVKKAVVALKEKGARQAETFLRDHRPWGWFETLALGDRFQVKRIVVHSGAALSLQSHMHRSEHWIVVSGTARVTIDDAVRLVTENQSVYIPLGARHRMENPGKMPMVLIEVQTGAYLGEDDIIRYEDVYSRGQGAKG
ncbi:mannose-1-phosphate guanylyltransferase/mannose-6-phosphate isomerase [Rhizobium sp. ARZ01]|uniref:mannose-1-phosphate guanylyltransferase/mannose-6-phosphate isomerase n=1 Tax=Rhizobium sp. ARZ01 TaxID=2769313 RepID=UPI00177C8831|nr:mannose-1-phosphate guanylyltransferase/mannose-6-phosphate isomerase [Rhizobium sp. ARZ01]MBD9373201.1 mannose-1-phosphate guanylyltransferase/mannose-6-phosphate isomerase [Rhizobium sp. ARZ01]